MNDHEVMKLLTLRTGRWFCSGGAKARQCLGCSLWMLWLAVGPMDGMAEVRYRVVQLVNNEQIGAINVEAIAYRNNGEMIIGLRSPLSGNANETSDYYAHQNRISGKAFYFRVTDVSQFLPAGGWNAAAQGLTGPHELDLGGQGIRSIEWCAQLAGGAGRYLIIGGPANGGPFEKEMFGERFSLYAWTGGCRHHHHQRAGADSVRGRPVSGHRLRHPQRHSLAGIDPGRDLPNTLKP
jgi:hypothetical protein